MRKRKLFFQIYAPFTLLTVASLVLATWYASSRLHNFYLRETVSSLDAKARILAEEFSNELSKNGQGHVDALAKTLGNKSHTRITVILPSGVVVGDSEETPAKMDNHLDRPEVRDALSRGLGSSTRFSHTLDKNMMYVAVPIQKDSDTIGVVRASKSVSSIDDAIRGVYFSIALGSLIVVMLAAIVGLLISKRVSKPIEEMRKGAQHFAQGDFDYRLPMPGTEELSDLSNAMRQMAEQLREQIRQITVQRNEQLAVLSSMVEGVLAVDAGERILSMNRAAGDMLGVNQDEAKGKTLQESVRNTALQKFVGKTLSEAKHSEEILSVQIAGEERFLQAHGALLKDSEGKQIGAVIVLNDITRLRKLENMRREFVANVSHELRTPITMVKGFVETLLDGAMKDQDKAIHFLDIISKHVDRLNAIIDDLLLLSSTEHVEDSGGIALSEEKVKASLQTAIDACKAKADSKSITISLEADDMLTTRMNAPLIEQAIINLIDNAVKYSEAGKTIEVKAQKSAREIVISVADHGCGIEKEHLPRLFERFYRVDKGRSRKLGGTGLGLAIVKHIAQAHGGSVSVESTPGQGSTFRIHLPVV